MGDVDGGHAGSGGGEWQAVLKGSKSKGAGKGAFV